jgi:sugar lactone lactonase YvrE
MDGFLIAADWSANLVRYTPEGDSFLWATDMGDPTGMEILPDDDLVVADRGQGRVVVRDRDSGGVNVIASSINWPNGLDVAPDGSVFVTESYAEAVYRIDPTTLELDLVASDIPRPDGIAFDPTYHTLYVAGLSRPEIVAIPVHGPGDYGEPYPLALPEEVPWTWVDGMQVDRCGNIYIADFLGDVWRLDPDTLVIDNILSEPGSSLPALRFGSGLGGWDAFKIYVSTYGEVIEVDVGVPNKARWPLEWP